MPTLRAVDPSVSYSVIHNYNTSAEASSLEIFLLTRWFPAAIRSRLSRERGRRSLRESGPALTLCSRPDNNLAHIYIGRLLAREHDGAGDRLGRHCELVSGAFELRFHLRICHAFREVRPDEP